VTVTAREAPEQGRADHAPCIEAVCRDLDARDIQVAEMAVRRSGDRRREATLLLRPDEGAFAEPVPAEASASWDEDDGWSLVVRLESLTSQVRKSLDMAPEQAEVAAWAVTVLGAP
jgi:hypothetical protein